MGCKKRQAVLTWDARKEEERGNAFTNCKEIYKADPTAESWTTFIGPTVGSATATAAAEDVIRRREQAFEELRLQGDGPDIGARMDFGRELGRISRYLDVISHRNCVRRT